MSSFFFVLLPLSEEEEEEEGGWSRKGKKERRRTNERNNNQPYTHKKRPQAVALCFVLCVDRKEERERGRPPVLLPNDCLMDCLKKSR